MVSVEEVKNPIMEKIWLKNYPKGVPSEINPDKYQSLNEIILETCQLYAEKPAFTNLGTTLDFQTIFEYSKAFASFLQSEYHLKKGDRIAIMMPNLLQYPIVMFGAFFAGLVVVNINPLYTARELTFQLQDSSANTIVVLENFAHTLEVALPNTTIQNVIITKVGDLLDFPKSLFVNWGIKYLKRKVPYYFIPNAVPFKKALKIGRHKPYKAVSVSSEDPAYLQYTGGTTGVAKGAILTHRNIIANLEQATAWVLPFVTRGEEIIVTALPLYHIFSLTANCWTFFKLGALNILITNPRDLKHFIKEIKRYPFTTITGVNTLFNALLNQPEIKSVDFRALKITLGGGMAVQSSVAREWKRVTGNTLLEAYGLTETSPAVCINPIILKEYNGSIGLPIPSTEISIKNEEGKEVGFNEPGELCVKGPQVMKEYWNKPEETKEVFTDGWLHTGDIATINEEGFLKIVDRKKDMILVSGFNVYPNEVEEVIAQINGVLEVAVIGIRDPETGERVKAFVVSKDPALTTEKIIQFCKTQLTRYKVPKEIEFRKELPKTNVGKILRRALKEE